MMEEWMIGNTLLRVTTTELQAVVVSGVSQGALPDRPAATSFSLNFNNLGSR
jgi:hypothetical protein